MKARDSSGRVGYDHGGLKCMPIEDTGMSSEDRFLARLVIAGVFLIALNYVYLISHGVCNVMHGMQFLP